MTKEKEERSELIWRLKQAPDAMSVAKLVEQKVLSPEEAREVVFGQEKEIKSKKIAALEEEVSFLRGLVDKLANQSHLGTVVYKTYKNYVPIYPTWYWSYTPAIATLGSGGYTNGLSLSSISSTAGTTGTAASTGCVTC